MTHLAAFAAAFVGVALKSTQQLSVVRGRWLWVPPVSYGLALCEITIIANVSRKGGNKWLLTLAIGTGAWLGCFVGMAIDHYLGG